MVPGHPVTSHDLLIQLDTEAGFFTTGSYLGKKKVLTIGGGFDAQSNYKAFAGDLFFDRPVGPRLRKAPGKW